VCVQLTTVLTVKYDMFLSKKLGSRFAMAAMVDAWCLDSLDVSLTP
jgi:hypothetical protein